MRAETTSIFFLTLCSVSCTAPNLRCAINMTELTELVTLTHDHARDDVDQCEVCLIGWQHP